MSLRPVARKAVRGSKTTINELFPKVLVALSPLILSSNDNDPRPGTCLVGYPV